MGAVGDNGVNGQSNKEWTRAENGGHLIRNVSGSGSGSRMFSIHFTFHCLKVGLTLFIQVRKNVFAIKDTRQ